MNRQSTLLSIIGHIVLAAVILLWGMAWPFKPREIQIDTVEIIDNASFEALVAQANIAQSDAIEPEPTPSPLTAENIAPADDVVTDDNVVPVSEEPVEIEIIQAQPAEPVAPTPPPAPVVPSIGDAAPRTAIAPPARPVPGQVQQAENTQVDEITELVETIVEQPAVTPPPRRDETGDAIEAVLGELGGDQNISKPVTSAPNTAATPPARVATSLNTADVETIAPDVTLDTGTATEAVVESDNTPTPSPDVAATAPAAPIVSAPPVPPARNAASLNIVESSPVVQGESVDDLVAQVVADTVEEESAVAPEPTPAPSTPEISGSAPRSAPVPPARTSSLNVVQNAPDTASEILAQLDGSSTQSNQGRALSRIETGSIIQQIARNWSIAPIADKSNLIELVVVVGFSVDSSGALNSPIELLDPSNPNGDQIAAFQTAERAILNTVPLNLPSDVDPNGVKWTLTFDPSTQSVGLA